VVEGTGLENRQWVTIRGFESHSLRQIRQGPRKGPLSSSDSRMAGPSAWREGEAQGRAEHIPLSPPDTTRAPQGAFVVSGARVRLKDEPNISHSLRQIRQGPRKGPLSCLGVKGGVDEAAGSTNSSGTNLDSRMAGPSAWREGEAQGRAEHIPLSPPDTTRAPQGAFVVSGGEGWCGRGHMG
jgi:hypothetical protein